MAPMTAAPFHFRIGTVRGMARTGVITTPHGQIRTPAFIPVGTKATVKGVLPESASALGAQAVLANAYHLYLQPGADLVDAAGGLSAFMNWPGPTFTDSGGFQVMSLGVGFKKVLAMQADAVTADDVIAPGRDRLAHVDDEGVSFVSHINGSKHRFTPESSMLVQHQLGADIMFAFDECTTLMNTRGYQERSVRRTAAPRTGSWLMSAVTGPTRPCSASSRVRSSRTCAARPPATWPAWTSMGSGSAGRWRRTSWRRSSDGSARSCPRTGRGTCWASASPTTSSPGWPQGLTRSTA
jgi:hypothetical protein